MKSLSHIAFAQIKVMIVDDHPLVREGLAAILQSQKDIKIVAEAKDGEEACVLYDEVSPDVIVLDLRMPNKDGLDVITELMSRRAPKPRIIVMTTYESEEDIRRALSAGVKGYLVKDADPQEIRDAIRAVAAGKSMLPVEIASKLAESMAHPDLTERERQVLQYIAVGKSNKEIGQMLYISENTVKGHVKSILTKLDALGRTEAIAIATRRGLIHPG
jgi:DNA-binding NarL/FixJ family response regulator